MIATNLIATMLMALGVATGNVSSNRNKGSNAFNSVVEKAEKPRQNAQINNNYELRYTTVDSINDTTNKIQANKSVLKLENEANTQPNLMLEPYLITNTFYSYSNDANYGSLMKDTQYYQILIFTSYVRGQQTIDLNAITTYAYTEGNNTQDVHWNKYAYVTESPKAYDLIDLTLNDSIINRIQSKINEIRNDGDLTEIVNTNGVIQQNNPVISNDNFTTPSIILEENQTKCVILYNYYTNFIYRQSANCYASRLTLSGHYITKDITQEIVDVPNIMFTILTLPFSFYSTAFNLTIFPGTPYALNFGNVILTIVAAMILLYLIRKIIK